MCLVGCFSSRFCQVQNEDGYTQQKRFSRCGAITMEYECDVYLVRWSCIEVVAILKKIRPSLIHF